VRFLPGWGLGIKGGYESVTVNKTGMKRYCLIIILAVISFLFTAARHVISGRRSYYFLNWNLLLAVIPLFISLIISSEFVRKKTKILTAALFAVWLVFFPNAPYIITDLYYLNNHSQKMFWYDLITILVFAWTGLLSGFLSLDIIKDVLLSKLSRVKSITVVCGLLFVCAFGIYLGRELRWNTWEIFIKPGKFFLDVINRFINPIGHKRTWAFTFLMGVFLNISYWSYKIIQKKD
jgi:uncharacterized membrane protein